MADRAAIGRQRRAFDVGPEVFRREIGRARTFGYVADVKKLWQAGFALGSSLENSVAIDGEAILNPEGLRYCDEFVRHKALDAIGDLSLAGAAIVGAYHVYRPGHTVNALALSALFADRKAYEIVEGGRGRIAPEPARRSGWRRPPGPPTGIDLVYVGPTAKSSTDVRLPRVRFDFSHAR